MFSDIGRRANQPENTIGARPIAMRPVLMDRPEVFGRVQGREHTEPSLAARRNRVGSHALVL